MEKNKLGAVAHLAESTTVSRGLENFTSHVFTFNC